MKFKKLTAMLTAFACAGVLASSFGMIASATDSEPCDVDGDGYVDIFDVITVNRYLSGGYYLPNYRQLDANRNLIVDAADVDLITAKITNQTCSLKKFLSREDGLISFPTVPTNTFIGDDYASSVSVRTYMRYSYISQSPLDDYQLYPSTTNAQTNIQSTYGIFGSDDRTVATNLPENSGIVRLSTGGTGFIVGDYTIATAAHCVYSLDSNNPHFLSDITINTYNSDGTLSSGTLTPVEVHIPQLYLTHGNEATYDYALVTVSEPLNNYVHFALGVSYDAIPTYFSNVPLYITGCPSSACGETNSEHSLYTAEGRIYPSNNSGFALHCDVDATGGQSGAPMYTITKQVINNTSAYVYTALGIFNTAGLDCNAGCRITKYQTQFYLGNPYANNGTNMQ